VAFPHAQHSGRRCEPTHAGTTCNMPAVDRLLTDWRWDRLVGKKTGQLRFDHRTMGLGKEPRGQLVAVRFDPRDRPVGVDRLGPTLPERGPEITRFHCPACAKETIIGISQSAPRPAPSE
jgi:hypothetical protein